MLAGVGLGVGAAVVLFRVAHHHGCDGRDGDDHVSGERDSIEGLLCVVGEAGERARDLQCKVGLLRTAREATEASALRALARLDDHFTQVREHKHTLTLRLQRARKQSYQPVSDICTALRVLSLLAGNGLRCALSAQHLGLAAGAVVEDAPVCVLAFGPPSGVLRAWKRVCRVHVGERGWDVHHTQPHPLPSLNAARRNHAAVVVSRTNDVLVMGGRGASAPLNSVERLRDGEGVWVEEAGLAIPTARSSCGACAVGTTAIVVGGFRAKAGACDVVEAVDTASGVHTSLPPLPARWHGCGVVGVQGKVVVCGGWDGSWSVFNHVWALDVGKSQQQQQQQQQHAPAQWTQLPDMGKGRCYHGAAAGGGCVFVCGGSTGLNATASCEMLDQHQRSWEALPPMPFPLDSMGCCYGGGNVFVVGGGGEAGAQRSVFALCVREATWLKVAELAVARLGCAAVCVGRRVLVLGGNGDNDQVLGCCEELCFA